MNTTPALTTGFIKLTQGHNFLLVRQADSSAMPGRQPEKRSDDAIIVLPPFAEEMNKSRHIIHQLMSALYQHDCFMLDNYGTGDSEGDITDASITLWRQDLTLLIEHLAKASYASISFIAIRFGALQLFDLLNHIQPAVPIKNVVFWQPIFDSAKFWQQFVRIKIAESMASGSKISQKEIEQQLTEGHIVEIAGYPINAAFFQSLQQLQQALPPLLSHCSVHWFEISQMDTVALPVQKMKNLLQQHTPLYFEQLKAEPFWQTQELAQADTLIAATVQRLGAQYAP